jgi:diguanylate cyclase (GGDEF)-like protein
MFGFLTGKKKIENLMREIEDLRLLTRLDALTGVYNRRGVIEESEKIFEQVRHGRRDSNARVFAINDFTVIFLDADNFKRINDTYGHDVGDTVLKLIADVLRQSVRKLDIIGRFGGEEFVVGLVGANQEYGAIVAERIRQDISKLKVKKGGSRVPITVSVGVKQQEREREVLDLIFEADKLMYKAKMSGKNKVVVAKASVKKPRAEKAPRRENLEINAELEA